MLIDSESNLYRVRCNQVRIVQERHSSAPVDLGPQAEWALDPRAGRLNCVLHKGSLSSTDECPYRGEREIPRWRSVSLVQTSSSHEDWTTYIPTLSATFVLLANPSNALCSFFAIQHCVNFCYADSSDQNTRTNYQIVGRNKSLR